MSNERYMLNSSRFQHNKKLTKKKAYLYDNKVVIVVELLGFSVSIFFVVVCLLVLFDYNNKEFFFKSKSAVVCINRNYIKLCNCVCVCVSTLKEI
jgi:hypothetical protein